MCNEAIFTYLVGLSANVSTIRKSINQLSKILSITVFKSDARVIFGLCASTVSSVKALRGIFVDRPAIQNRRADGPSAARPGPSRDRLLEKTVPRSTWL